MYFEGSMPGVPTEEVVLLRTRILGFIQELSRKYRMGPFHLRVGSASPQAALPAAALPAGLPAAGDGGGAAEPAVPRRDSDRPTFTAIEPLHTLELLALPDATRERLLDCISFVELVPLVFGDWGLRAIEPHPSIAVNFRGPPGTGKTLAAHAAAHHLKKKIMLCRLSDLESKFHGQGPKNLVTLFESARAQDAVLFIDEAESLLSRRFAHPDQAAESAINSMRTELLMALDSFDGLVIFASNLPHSYDVAVESRLLHVDFALPDQAARTSIWRAHMPAGLPVADDVSVERLAEIDGVSGRDIKLAVISAAVGAARRGASRITSEMLRDAIDRQRRPVEPAPAPLTGSPAEPASRQRIVDAVHRYESRTAEPAARADALPEPA